ncbi:hypothetical protein SBD_0600 [Streptomyces bottropensis ATCC 25435]|uniref:Uncharacterized protein n=1 Tax=Streptomyces bottropensis ATCC 25435 TaxID=1054862 RepID=M3DLV9_9ACTN|nr:hypothetical protein SBD_0600 [Streptomyces bottropensis ATCC 25435]
MGPRGALVVCPVPKVNELVAPYRCPGGGDADVLGDDH